MIRHYVLTTTGSAQLLSTALSGALPNPIRTISIQPFGTNAAASYIGGAGVSSTDYGVRMEAGAAGIPPAPFVLGEYTPAWLKLDELYVNGTNNEKLAILVDYFL